jgi:hypothetical protein
MIVIRVIGFAAGYHCPIAGQYLETFDHDAYNGQGHGTFTVSPKQAMKFDGLESALEFWKKVSPKHPIRQDGEPNRPLTCTTVTFDTVEG